MPVHVRACARHAAGFTFAFEDMVTRLAAHCSKSVVYNLMRIAWRSVGRVVTRVVADASDSRFLGGHESHGLSTSTPMP